MSKRIPNKAIVKARKTAHRDHVGSTWLMGAHGEFTETVAILSVKQPHQLMNDSNRKPEHLAF